MTDRASQDFGKVVINAVAGLLVLSYALPYVYLVSTSLKPAADVQQIPPSFFPNQVSLENFATVIGTAGLPEAFFNSTIVAVMTTMLSLVIAVPAAYVSALSNSGAPVG